MEVTELLQNWNNASPMTFHLSHGRGRSALAATFAALASPALAHATQSDFCMSVSTDAMDPMPYPVAYAGQNGLAYALLGDDLGGTPTISLDASQPRVVRIDEVPLTVNSGLNQFPATSIGQHFTLQPLDATAGPLRLHYFQPVARQIGFYPPYGVSDNQSGWSASGSDTATYGFQAYVAELPTDFVISNYFAWKIGWHVDLFQHGLLLRADDWVDLGAEGINFHIDRSGYDYGADGPVASTFAMEMQGYGSYLTVDVKGVDAEKVDFQLYGYLAPGDNLILFGDPEPGGVYQADDLGTIIGGGEGTDSDCTLPPPPCATAGTCAPPMPGGAVMGGATTCSDWGLPIGPELKPGCGSTAGFDVCTTWEGGMSWEIEISTPGGGLTIGNDGRVGGSHCVNVTAQGGWKVQAYQCFKKCERTWDITWVPWYSIFPRHGHKTTSCIVNGGIATSTCQFQQCP